LNASPLALPLSAGAVSGVVGAASVVGGVAGPGVENDDELPPKSLLLPPPELPPKVSDENVVDGPSVVPGAETTSSAAPENVTWNPGSTGEPPPAVSAGTIMSDASPPIDGSS